MVQKKSLIFDLDGTLINVSKRLYKLHHYLSKKFRYDPYTKKEYFDLKNSGIREKELMNKKLSPPNTQEYLSIRQSLIETEYYLSFDKLKPSVKKLLQALFKDRTLILTTARHKRRNLIKQLSKLNIIGFFTQIITGESLLIRQKKLKRIIGKETEKFVLIGDTADDYLLAKILNINSILICDGVGQKNELLKLRPTKIFDKISFLKNELLEK